MSPQKRGVLKVLVYVAGGLVVTVILAYVGIVLVTNSMLTRSIEVPATVEPITVRDGDPVAVTRGEYLVDHVANCKICHAADFGGRAEVDDPMVGRLWAPNLTPGRGSAVTNYRPVDWARSIRHGVAPDGHRLVLMPSEDFYKFSNDDIGAIVAYVKSFPAVDRADENISLGPLGRVLLLTGEVSFAFDKIDHSEPRPDAQPGPTKEWGSVLIGACQGCHGPTLSGGKIPGAPPEWPAPRNLTPHETGLKNWTYEQFSTAITTGTRPDGTQLSEVMPWKAYAGMTADDRQALWAHLRTVTPKEFGGR